MIQSEELPARCQDAITRHDQSGETLQEIAESAKQTPDAIGQLPFWCPEKIGRVCVTWVRGGDGRCHLTKTNAKKSIRSFRS